MELFLNCQAKEKDPKLICLSQMHLVIGSLFK